MNRLVLIGNGFDLAHGLKTSYGDFINWYWGQRVDSLLSNYTNFSDDCLCRLEIKETTGCANWFSFFYTHSYRNSITKEWNYPPFDIIKSFKENTDDFLVTYTKFFERILYSIETKGWVDIENDYYQLLKKCTEDPNCDYSVNNLNNQLDFLKEKLIKYLRSMRANQIDDKLKNKIIDFFNPADFSTEGKSKALDSLGLEINDLDKIECNVEKRNKLIPEHIMLLSFNYTATSKMYNNFNVEHIYIHGDLEYPNSVIFGYGDELDDDFKRLQNLNDNECLRQIKSIRYLESDNYRKMLEFIESAPFQIYIMGHSCGTSDRTLLNTLFEHKNCVSIKPYYYVKKDKTDNYLELVQNISRNFKDMKLMRDRVVNKKYCEQMS